MASTTPIRVLVTGANGQLGQELMDWSKVTGGFIFHFKNSSDLDITDSTALFDCFNENQYQYCINCAAYTQVDRAEEEREKCYNINVEAVQLLANICSTKDVILLHISSDYVYHLDNNIPLVETDPCMPKGFYALTKYLGEELVLKASPNHIIIRTSWVYSIHGNNFVKTMQRLAQSRDQLSIVNDQIGTPTYAKDLAKVLIDIIKINYNSFDKVALGGIYNFSNNDQTNWCEFAKTIFTLLDLDINVSPIPSKDYPTPAERPKWSVMDMTKLKSTFDIEIRSWKSALKEMIDHLLIKDA